MDFQRNSVQNERGLYLTAVRRGLFVHLFPPSCTADLYWINSFQLNIRDGLWTSNSITTYLNKEEAAINSCKLVCASIYLLAL